MLATALSAIALGLLSSLHCVGMCGPLLLALPFRNSLTTTSSASPALRPLLYHTGRILTYSSFGLLFGLLGRHIYLAGWQQRLSITLGALILAFFLLRRLPVRLPKITLVQRLISRLWQAPSTPTFFLLGMANGLLPCGMVYLAAAAALTRTTTTEATLFMSFFGIGTLPLLVATQWFGHRIAPSLRPQLRRCLPIVTVTVGLLLILRGLNLGIPFISPHLAAAPAQVVSCH
jgi:sulfite exporter TauE/SafE